MSLNNSPWSYLFTILIAFAPLIPLALVVVPWRMQHPVRRTTAMALAMIVTIVGGLLTLVICLVGSGAGYIIVFMQGGALAIAVSASIMLLSKDKTFNDFKSFSGSILIVPILIALWSLTSAAAVVVQASNLSDDNGYCIATHSPLSAVRSLAQLRGLSFYTTASGYKDNSTWYFHGLMIVGYKDVYNWSPRRMRFSKVERPHLFVESPMNACSPQKDFWRSIPVL